MYMYKYIYLYLFIEAGFQGHLFVVPPGVTTKIGFGA